MISLICGDALNIPLPDGSIQCVITSPPYYGLRDYGVSGQIGLEQTPELYISKMVEVFREVRRVLRDDGTLWLVMGDSYAGSSQTGGTNSISGNGKSQPHVEKSKRIARGSGRWGGGNIPATGNLKPKDLIGIPWMLAFALRADGWYLRSDIIWHKPNPMPESVTDRLTKAHEYVFLLGKSQRYYYDANAIREPHKEASYARQERAVSNHHKNINGAPGQPPHTIARPRPNAKGLRTALEALDEGHGLHPLGRNKRTVWEIPTYSYRGSHFATFPPALVEPCLLAGSKDDDIVLDPFAGTFTVGMVAAKYRRSAVGIELNPKYIELAQKRCKDIQVRLI